MNLIEHYILEIHGVRNYKDLIIADVTVNCYGRITRTEHTTTKELWEKEKIQGYFMR